jgi:glycosyltransferase involved in cell wall biosynthesis
MDDTASPAGRPITVASVPATHVYVRRLAHPAVRRLRDPSGDDRRTPRFLDPSWWARVEEPPDLLHVHFGFEYYDPSQLEQLRQVLTGRGVPLVYTVHDLRNPNHASPDLHDGGLDVLLDRADELVTLTDWAAQQIRQRCGRRAAVLPHPHVADLDRIGAARRRAAIPTGRTRVGIHFKSLRANMVRAPLLDAAATVARAREDLTLEVHLHCDVVSPRGANHDAELVALACDLADEGLVDLHVHPYLDHDDLLDLVERCDAYVLPYTFGTHSGLLELCKDLGTAVIAPSCGGYADQGAHHIFDSTEEHGFDPESFRETLNAACDAGAPEPADPIRRQRERATTAERYLRIYQAALGRTAATRSGQEAGRGDDVGWPR